METRYTIFWEGNARNIILPCCIVTIFSLGLNFARQTLRALFSFGESDTSDYYTIPIINTYNTVKPLYSGHPWDVANWLLYKGGLIIPYTFNREVLFGTLLGGCFREVTFLYRFAI